MRTYVVFGFIILFFLLSLQSRVAALNTYWWFAIFRPHEWVWGSLLSDLKLPLIAAFLFVVPSLLQKNFPKIDNPIAVLMLILLGLEFIANIVNGCSFSSYIIRTKTLSELVILIATVLLSAELVKSRNILFWLISVVGFSLALHSGKGGIYALISGSDFYGASNLKGLFTGSNAYALGTGMLLFFMIFCFQFINKDVVGESKRMLANQKFRVLLKFVMLVMILGSIYNIIALQSRGSFLATTIALFLWILLHEKKVKLLLSATLILTITLSVVPLPEGYTDRINSIFSDDEDRDKSAASRPYFWGIAGDIASSYPLGTGPGCYPVYYNLFDVTNGEYGRNRSVHSSHFQILSDTGYLGVIVWILLHFVSLKKLWNIRKQAKQRYSEHEKFRFYFYVSNTLTCTIVVFMIGGSFYEYAYNEIIWLVWALVIATERLFKKEEEIASVQKT